MSTMKNVKSRIQSIFRLKPDPPALATPESGLNSEFGAGAILPPELFPRVLQYVSRDDRRVEAHEKFMKRPRKFDKKSRLADSIRYDQEIAKAGPLYTLRSCALVCGYWANQCRRYMFFKATVHLRSLQDAELFRLYAIQGSRRLIRICRLISAVEVHQSYSSSRSFADLACTPATEKKLLRLQIQGPVPAGFPPAKLDTPHWGFMSPGVMPPPVTSYKCLLIRDVTYPSFSHISRCLKHFGDTKEFHFFALNWGGKAAGSIAQFDKPAIRARDRMLITAEGCADDLAICTQTAMMYPDFALRTVPDRDQRWAMQMMRNLFEFYSEVPMNGKPEDVTSYELDSYFPTNSRSSSFSFGVQHIRPDYSSASIRFVCEPKSRKASPSHPSGRKSPDPIRIVGIMIVISAALRSNSLHRFSTIDLTFVRREIEQRCALRVVAFGFKDYATLRALTQQHPTLLEHLSNESAYAFACYRTPEHRFPEVIFDNGDGQIYPSGQQNWVGIDPITLQTTGEQWSSEEAILPSLLESRRCLLSQ